MSREAFLQDAGRLLEEGIGWAGLAGDALAFVLADVAARGRWLVVVDEEDRAERLLDALALLHPHPEHVLALPADDVKPYDGFSPSPERPRTRLGTLHRVAEGGDVLVVASVAALMRRVPDAGARRASTRMLRRGEALERDVLRTWLAQAGYLATGRVEEPGAFAARGDVVDVWSPGAAAPLRVDFFDDEIEALRPFDPATQRTRGRLESALVLPAREDRLDAPALERAGEVLSRLVREQGRGANLRRRVFEDWRAGVRFSGGEDWLPALVPTEAPLDALAGLRRVVWLPDDVAVSARDLEASALQRWEALDEDERPLVPPGERFVPAAVVLDALRDAHPVVEFAKGPEAADLGARPVDGFSVRGAELAPIARRLQELAAEGSRVVLVVEEGTRALRTEEMLAAHGVRPRPIGAVRDARREEISLVFGGLSRGFLAASSGWAVIPADAMFGQRRHHRLQQAHAHFDVGVRSLSQLKEGDHVVHRLHGIGLYQGLQRLPVQGAEQDFVRLAYRDGDLLYLPVTALDQLSRYTPSREGSKVKLDRLGGATWAKRRAGVKDAVLAMAQEMIAVHARRELAMREPFPPPGAIYRAFEARFPYEETPDQATAIVAVQDDLSGETPMDRLVCGDVGFGKTEVAMRAAMRVAEAGRQVAVLCPTTVLAFQHWRTFRERFDGLPVKVAMLSRFVGPAEERKVLAGLRAGEVDVLIGTTRVLGRGVRFRDLALLVIDEEHRFGVRQKERLKKLRAGLDVLAMSATPIPRTLEMALSGLRDMSVMATPPEERLTVRTSVSRLSRARVRDAVLQEMERSGQVFFIHNRIESIEEMASTLREWVPEARLAVAHGQMEAEQLEDILIRFIQRDLDVLVSTSIVESGVDLPNVNTLLVNRADQFGLAQLYQLRGRVGRGATRGNCILLTPEETTRDARRRLRVLVENTHLGAGFQIATSDLELRGGGNLLGDSQHGHIDEVGYDMWMELLQEAVHEARGDLDRQRIEPEVEVPVPAFIPERYLPDTTERLQWYRRFAAAPDAEAIDKLLDELDDFEGEAPPEARNLAGVLQIKAECRALGVVRCSWLKVRALLELHPRSPMRRDALAALVAAEPRRYALIAKEGGPVQLEVRFLPQEGERPLHFLRWVMARLRRDAL